MMKRGNAIVTDELEVRWSHLHKPDNKFGIDASNHNITVVLDEDTYTLMDKTAKEMGCTKINGLKTDDEGIRTLKSKTKLFVRDDVNVFPCVDAAAKSTEATPYGGDKVKLKLTPVIIERDNSLSMFLNGVQIVKKGERSGINTGGFEPTEGFDGSNYQAQPASASTETTEDDLPF